jgi:hypothetical protein
MDFRWKFQSFREEMVGAIFIKLLLECGFDDSNVDSASADNFGDWFIFGIILEFCGCICLFNKCFGEYNKWYIEG